jgi:RNA polymerase sigma factor (sigma-70 family)
LTEQQLISRLKQKDGAAFKELVERYEQEIFNIVLNIVQDQDEADDCAQEVFIKVYEHIDNFKEEAALGTWMYRIAVRQALDAVRKRKRRKGLQQWLPWWMPEENKKDKQVFHHPGAAMENKETAANVFKAINRLPEKQKIAFTLIRIQGMSYAETAEIMQQSIKAVESLMSRSRQNLEKYLQQLI